MSSIIAGTICALVLGTASAGAADSVALSGSIDGVAIPDAELNIPRETVAALFLYKHLREPVTAEDGLELQTSKSGLVCSHLRAAVEGASRERQKRELGIDASQAELDVARQKAISNSEEPLAAWTRIHDRATVLSAALSAVYDQGQDAGQVFHVMVEPHGINEGMWAQYLHTGRSPEGRAKLASVPTLDSIVKARDSYNERPLAENEKLGAVVDGQIARADPTFSAYLEEWRTRAQDPDPKKRWVSAGHKQYLDEKRASWERSQVASLVVVLSDPSLVTSCGLSSLGVRATGQ